MIKFPGISSSQSLAYLPSGQKIIKIANVQATYGNNQMEISFTHTYGNLIIWGLGFVGVSLYLSKTIAGILIITLPVCIVLFLLILLFHLFEKTCCISCCSPCCLPFTERSVFGEDSDKQDTEQQQQSEGDLEMTQVA